MPQIRIVVREIGSKKIDFSLLFYVPSVPCPGDYISIHRQDEETPHTEDVVVRKIWWRLETSETRTVTIDETEQVGDVREIVVECEPAIGPYSTDRWRDGLAAARARGGTVEEFEIVRLSVRQDAVKGS